jgi:uncharacterized protein (TIGR02246 family)
MKALSRPMIAAGAAMALSAGIAAADETSDRKNIESVLARYEQALNASDVDAVMTLYADDGVFMAQHSPPNVGRVAIRRAYDSVFEAIDLDVRFTVDEVIQASPQWAFARTRSEGFVTINATGDRAPEGNQELFVFEKQDSGEWKISRYIFSTTNPPRQ